MSADLQKLGAKYDNKGRVFFTDDTSVLDLPGLIDVQLESYQEFLDNYIEQGGKDLLGSVGGYKIEGPGVLLFDEVEGSFFTILGVPLLHLLAFFREQKILLL